MGCYFAQLRPLEDFQGQVGFHGHGGGDLNPSICCVVPQRGSLSLSTKAWGAHELQNWISIAHGTAVR